MNHFLKANDVTFIQDQLSVLLHDWKFVNLSSTVSKSFNSIWIPAFLTVRARKYWIFLFYFSFCISLCFFVKKRTKGRPGGGGVGSVFWRIWREIVRWHKLIWFVPHLVWGLAAAVLGSKGPLFPRSVAISRKKAANIYYIFVKFYCYFIILVSMIKDITIGFRMDSSKILSKSRYRQSQKIPPLKRNPATLRSWRWLILLFPSGLLYRIWGVYFPEITVNHKRIFPMFWMI